jgi:hypothetical protein
MPRETEIVGYRNRAKPDLRRHVFAIDMHMGWFATIVACEVNIVWPCEPDGRHGAWLPLLMTCSKAREDFVGGDGFDVAGVV